VPAWIEDDDLDCRHTCAPPRSHRPFHSRQLLDLVALFEVIPFDHDYPPWTSPSSKDSKAVARALYFRAHQRVTTGSADSGSPVALLDEVGWPRSLQSGRAEKSARKAPTPTRSDRQRGTVHPST